MVPTPNPLKLSHHSPKRQKSTSLDQQNYLMMGSSRTNEKGKGIASGIQIKEESNDFQSSIASNVNATRGLNFFEDLNVDDDNFDFVPDMFLSMSGWDDIHQSITLGIPETIGNPRVNSLNLNSFQNPQINLSSDTVNTNLQEVPLLPDWNSTWGQHSMNQGHNTVSSSGISNFVGESNFGHYNSPQVNRDITGSSFMFQPRDTAPVRTRSNLNFNYSQCGVPGKVDDNFLSLGIGGTEEATSNRSQPDTRDISVKLKEAASAELPTTHASQTFDADLLGLQRNNSGISNCLNRVNQMTSTNQDVGVRSTINSGLGSSLQTSGQSLNANFLGFQRNSSAFSNQFSNMDRMTTPKNKNEIEVQSTLNSGTSFSPHHILPMQQNDMVHHVRNIRSRARSSAGPTLGQTLGADFMGFQQNSSGLSNQFTHVNQVTSSNEVGVQSTSSSRRGSSPRHILPMQQNVMQHGKNIRSGDLDHHSAFVSNQAVHSGTLGGNSTQFLNSQQRNLNNLAQRSVTPSYIASHTPSGQLQNIHSMNSPFIGLGSSSTQQNYAGMQGLSHNAMPTQVLGGNLFSQRTAAPQVSWVGSGLAVNNSPFPKRLGVEFNVRNTPQTQTAQRHLSSSGTSLQTTSTGQMRQFPDKGFTRLPDHGLRPSVVRTDGAPVSYPMNSQQPYFAHHGQSQNAPIQLLQDPQGVASANASTVRPYLKRPAVLPPASHWVQRQKINHPTVHHSSQRPTIPATSSLVRPAIPIMSQKQPALPVPGPVASQHFRPRIPVSTTPSVFHITWKDPDSTSKLTGYKCFLCKRDVALTSEGPVYQPTAPPPVAILPCGHTFHDQCLQNITPQDQAKDPPCIPCAIGEN